MVTGGDVLVEPHDWPNCCPDLPEKRPPGPWSVHLGAFSIHTKNASSRVAILHPCACWSCLSRNGPGTCLSMLSFATLKLRSDSCIESCKAACSAQHGNPEAHASGLRHHQPTLHLLALTTLPVICYSQHIPPLFLAFCARPRYRVLVPEHRQSRP